MNRFFASCAASLCGEGLFALPLQAQGSAVQSRTHRWVRGILGALVCALTANNVAAATIFESGTLGPTGIARNDVTSGSNVNASVFVGVRFYLDQPVITTQIGGHFVKNTDANQSFFGAIVALTDQNDFPDSGNLSTSDVIGTSFLAFPEPSNEVLGTLERLLNPGWYALVFGSGLFGASGSGVGLNNGADLADPVYIGWQPGSGWFNLSNLSDVIEFNNFHFLIIGSAVPEPSTFALGLTTLVIAALAMRRR